MANATSGPCPHCGQQHADDVLLCPSTERLIPLEGKILDGKFRFVKLLGEGGMGAVWMAENMLVKKTVAIKLMHVQFSRDEGVLARFRNEATAAGRIGSKHICDILDLGRSQLGPYIVLEMLVGSDFADFVVKRGGRIDPGVIVMIMRQALIGLAAAHGKGIVHRDLKPENIFLHEPEPGRLLVKLMDFGISKFTEGENAGKTGMGVLMGTPEYMSPEQTEGAASVDARTDIWAMGVILYWALAGRNPFVGQTMAATLINVAVREPPPLEQLAPHVTPGLVEVVARCIRKNPAERWGSCQELYEALAPFENLQGAPWVPASATAISTGAPPPVPAVSPSAVGATVIGGPSQVGGASISHTPGAQAQRPPLAPSAPTLGTQGTPAATGPTWSSQLPSSVQSAPTVGGIGSFEGVTDDRRPDRNIGSGGGKGLLIGVLALVVAGAGGVGWYVFNAKQAANVAKNGVAVAGDGDTKADTAGDAKADTAGDAKADTAGDAKADTADPTAGAASGDAGNTAASDTAGKVTGDTPDPTGDTPDPTAPATGDTPDPTGDTPDPTGGGGTTPTPKPKKPDMSKMKVVGNRYVATPASRAPSFLVAAADCKKKADAKYGHVKGWKLIKAGDAKAIAGVSKAWVADKQIWDGNKVVQQIGVRASYAAFCVAKK